MEEEPSMSSPKKMEEDENSQKVLLGNDAGVFIQDGLSANDDPMAFIYEFQEKNGLKMESCQSVLPFLDIFKVPRQNVYKNVLENIRKTLLDKIDTLEIQALDELLHRSFAYIQHPELRAIPMNVMKRIPTISPTILEHLMQSDELYEICPIEVKRKIWLENTEASSLLFRKHLFSLYENFIRDPDIVAGAGNLAGQNISPTTRWNHPSIIEIMKAIGDDAKMYTMVIESITTLFKSTRNRLFCTLRSDILMALHNADVEGARKDDYFNFSWCLDGFKRDGALDERRFTQLQTFFQKLHDKRLGEVGMIVLDPYAMNPLLKHIYGLLTTLMKQRMLPKNSDKMKTLSLYVTLGFLAWDLLQQDENDIPKIEAGFLTEFLPPLTTIIVDVSISTLDPSYKHGDIDFSKKWCDIYKKSEFAQKMVGFHLLNLIQTNNENEFQRLCKCIVNHELPLDSDLVDTLGIMIGEKEKDNQEQRSNILSSLFTRCSRYSSLIHTQTMRILLSICNSRSVSSLVLLLRELSEKGKVENSSKESIEDLKEVYLEMIAKVTARTSKTAVDFLQTFIDTSLVYVEPEPVPEEEKPSSPEKDTAIESKDDDDKAETKEAPVAKAKAEVSEGIDMDPLPTRRSTRSRTAINSDATTVSTTTTTSTTTKDSAADMDVDSPPPSINITLPKPKDKEKSKKKNAKKDAKPDTENKESVDDDDEDHGAIMTTLIKPDVVTKDEKNGDDDNDGDDDGKNVVVVIKTS